MVAVPCRDRRSAGACSDAASAAGAARRASRDRSRARAAAHRRGTRARPWRDQRAQAAVPATSRARSLEPQPPARLVSQPTRTPRVVLRIRTMRCARRMRGSQVGAAPAAIQLCPIHALPAFCRSTAPRTTQRGRRPARGAAGRASSSTLQRRRHAAAASGGGFAGRWGRAWRLVSAAPLAPS